METDVLQVEPTRGETRNLVVGGVVLVGTAVLVLSLR